MHIVLSGSDLQDCPVAYHASVWAISTACLVDRIVKTLKSLTKNLISGKQSFGDVHAGFVVACPLGTSKKLYI